MNAFGRYSQYYDLLYREKKYQEEVEYIDNIIQRYKPDAQLILDLGCGTGNHDFLFSERNYIVHGIDISNGMLRMAKRKEVGSNLIYSKGDIRTIRLGKTFDTVISLFHVISYQTSNEDIISTFQTANEHLAVGGIFIFDCWYGPAVLFERPEIRIKIVEDDKMKIIRIAEPLLHPNDNVVVVKYHIFLERKAEKKINKYSETHKMRYLFKPEVEIFLNSTGFKLVDYFTFLSNIKPDNHTWSVLFIGEKYE